MKRLLIVALFVCVVFAVIGAWNYFTVSRPVALANGNQQIRVWAHYQHYVNASVLSFDLRKTGGGSMMDVFMVFLRSANALASHSFQKVELQYRGNVRFLVEGTYFKQLGSEGQNPIFTMRTFTSHLCRPDGAEVFPGLTRRFVGRSGLIGMLNQMTEDADQYSRELEQFSAFSEQWYLSAQ
jgi:hypothetical protein